MGFKILQFVSRTVHGVHREAMCNDKSRSYKMYSTKQNKDKNILDKHSSYIWNERRDSISN